MSTNELVGYELSPQQRRLWQLQNAGQSKCFGAQCVALIEGPLDKDVLQAALSHVVRTHQILRTRFFFSAEVTIPLQVIDDAEAASLTHHDLSSLDPQEQQEQINELLKEHKFASYDPINDPPLRVALLTQSHGRHLLLLTLPALCADMKSLDNLVREISHSYSAHRLGETAEYEPIQYIAAAEWQNELLQAEAAEAGRAYWRRQDFGSALDLRLPFQSSSVSDGDFVVESFRFTVDAVLRETAAQAARGLNTTESTFLLACWQTLLWRLSEREPITTGIAFDGRTDSDLNDALGLYARYLPLKVDMSEETRFAALVGELEEECDQASDWQECFSWEFAEAGSGRSGGAPFLPYTFAYYWAAEAIDEGEVGFRIVKQWSTIDRFRLELECRSSDEELSCELRYDAGVFTWERMARLGGQFQKMLESASVRPDGRLTELRLLPEEQREHLCDGMNRTRREVDRRLVHELIEEQAGRTPEATSVIYKDRALSYEELERRANQMAHRLVELGVGPEVMVAVYMPRGFEMVVSLLGVLKAGGAYVPIDVSYPKQRVKYMLEDSGAGIVLTVNGAEEEVIDSGVKVVSVDGEWEEMNRWSTERPGVRVERENAAYVIYTSGTTGKPKGVVVSHGALSNHMQWMSEAVPLERMDRVLQKTSVSFDASVWEFYLPLMRGAGLVMLEEGKQRESRALVDAIREQEVSVVQGVPTLLRMLVGEEGLSECQRLRRVMSGGEALSQDLAEELRRRTGAQVMNLYGPTEATIEVSYKVSDRRGGGERVSIGRPIWNAEMYVVEVGGELAPVGMSGEIYLGGEGLARAYKGKAVETAERFMPDWLSGRGGERLYRTGDVGRVNEEWEIEYVGRVDEQVKVRGNRVEIKEVEEVIRRQRGVKEAAVVAEEDEGGGKRLVAYVEIGEEWISAKEIRRGMREEVPEYLVPAEVVVVVEMPVTGSGKVDKRRLAEVKRSGAEKRQSGERRSAVEEVVAGIWEELLQVNQVRGDDNFFDLGGHSLLGTLLITRLRRAFQMELPLSLLFESPTVTQLARRIEDMRREEQGLQRPPIERVLRDRALPLSFGQSRLWFLDQMEPGSPLYNMPAAIQFNGPLSTSALRESIHQVVRRHEILRTTFQVVNDRPAQVISATSCAPVLTVDLNEIDGDVREIEIRRLADEESAMPFDLSTGPLLRVKILSLDTTRHVVLVTMHHIVSDGWSMGVLIREVGQLYEAFSKGSTPMLPELPIQYADYAVWQNDWLQGEVLEEQLAYWKEQLGDTPPTLDLLGNGVRPALSGVEGGSRSIDIGEELTANIKSLSRQEGASLFMTLIAAFKTLLFRYAGQDDIIVGSPVANRNQGETEDLIGFFVNMLPLRTSLAGDPSFRELIGRVREVALGAYDHQDMPFEKLVEALHSERLAHTNPLFQVVFSLQNAMVEPAELTDLSLTPVETGSGTVSFDLILTIGEAPDHLFASLAYNTELFSSRTIAQMLNQYESLLEQVVATPDEPLSSLRLLTDEQTGGISPEDYPDAELNQKELENLILEIYGDSASLA